MDRALDETLKILDTLEVPATGAVALDEEYLTRVARVESLPRSQSGADKTWVWQLMEADRVFRSRLRRL